MCVTSGIFKVAGSFDVDSPAKNILFRDDEFNGVYSNIEPALEGASPVHAVIVGGYATGKTTVMKQVINKIKSKTKKIVPTYIDCREGYNKSKMYSFIYKEVFNKNLTTKISANRIKEKIFNELSSSDRALILALDDVNYLFNKKWGHDFMSELLRAHQTYSVRIGLLPLLPSLEYRYKFDMDLRTMFVPNEVTFPHYTFEEVYGILKDRCCYGFHKDVINQEVLLSISDDVVKNNNLRLGLNILRNLGTRAGLKNNVIDMKLYEEYMYSAEKYI